MLTFKEFQKLSIKERCERYKEMNDHDRFLARISQDITTYHEKPDTEKIPESQESPADDHKEQNTSTETK